MRPEDVTVIWLLTVYTDCCHGWGSTWMLQAILGWAVIDSAFRLDTRPRLSDASPA